MIDFDLVFGEPVGAGMLFLLGWGRIRWNRPADGTQRLVRLM